MAQMIADSPSPSIGDDYVSRLFQIESGGNPDASTGSYRGLGQFGPAEEARYGLNDDNRSDPTAQANAVRAEAAEHYPALRKALGRDPTQGELYLAHQQGIAGAPALLTADPNMPAWQAIRPYYKSDAIAQQAITGNVPRGSPLYGKGASDVTAGDFSNYWVGKFQGGGAPSPTVASAAAPAPAPAPLDIAAPDTPAPSPTASLGMLNPGSFAKAAQQFGAGPGLLNTGAPPLAPAPLMTPPPTTTPYAQALRQRLLQSILKG